MNIWVRRALVGGAAGLAGTAVMTLPMLGAKATGVIAQPPPRTIARNLSEDIGLRQKMDRQEFSVAWLAAHLGYGASSGALFGLLRPFVPLAPPVAGAIYGTLLWAVSYLGLMPALGLYPMPRSTSPAVVAVMLPAHWVYGAVAGETDERLLCRPS